MGARSKVSTVFIALLLLGAEGCNATVGAIVFPIYPGAVAERSSTRTPAEVAAGVIAGTYDVPASADVVSAWYRDHLPSSFRQTTLTVKSGLVHHFEMSKYDEDQVVTITAHGNGAIVTTTTIEIRRRTPMIHRG